MNLIHSSTAHLGCRTALLALFGSLLLAAPAAHAQYLEVGPTGTTFAADSGTSQAYRVDLFSGSGWLGNDCRLVSFLGGELWRIDTPLDLEFTGMGSSLESFGLGVEINDSLSFTSAGFITTGTWNDGITQHLGIHRKVDGQDYYGALTFRYNQDNSISLLQFAIAMGSFNTSQFDSLLPIPEPHGAAASLAALALVGAILRRRRGRSTTRAIAA